MLLQLDSNQEREAALKATADKATDVLKAVRAERDGLESSKKHVEEEFGSLKQAARAAMLELANQRQKSELEVQFMDDLNAPPGPCLPHMPDGDGRGPLLHRWRLSSGSLKWPRLSRPGWRAS